MNSKVKLQVWWVPQLPMKSFDVPVDTVEEGRKICEVLANYDIFQFENNVKGDYCNAGGVVYSHPTITDGEWHGWPDDEIEELELIDEINRDIEQEHA